MIDTDELHLAYRIAESCLSARGVQGPRTIFALDEFGDLRHVDEFATSTPGLICPDCRSEVRPRKFKGSTTDHFFHLRTKECRAAGETALHIMGKEVIRRSPEIRLPQIQLQTGSEGGYKSGAFVNGRWEGVSRVDQPNHWPKLKIKNVRLEVYEDGIRPDLIITDHKDRDLYVEIYVTHKVDERKRRIIVERRKPTIEIDLSNIARNSRLDAISDSVLMTAPRQWIFNSVIEERRDKLIAWTEAEASKRARAKSDNIEKRRERANRSLLIWSNPSSEAPTLRRHEDYETIFEAMKRLDPDGDYGANLHEMINQDCCSNNAFKVHTDMIELEIFNIAVIQPTRNLLSVTQRRSFLELRDPNRYIESVAKSTWQTILDRLTDTRLIKSGLEKSWGEHLDDIQKIDPRFFAANNFVEDTVEKFIDKDFLKPISKRFPSGFMGRIGFSLSNKILDRVGIQIK